MTYEVDGEQYVATLVGWGGSYAILGGSLSTISGRSATSVDCWSTSWAAPQPYRLRPLKK